VKQLSVCPLGLLSPVTALLSAVLLVVTGVLAQVGNTERTIHASKSQVENALRRTDCYPGGKLPTLEGFATAAGDVSLEHFQRGYYQYSVHVVPVNAGEVRLRVFAKITAWYAAPNPARSGYKTLASNGRLESDLLDRMEELLGTATSSSKPLPGKSEAEHFPDSPLPSLSGTSSFKNPKWTSASQASRQKSHASNLDEKQIQDLREQERTFEQVLEHQSHPNNLASVKDPDTPIFSRPSKDSQTVLTADAEDEFQILDTDGPWVHVQISGLSRGWIQRSQLDLPEMPGEYSNANAADGTDALADFSQPFRQTREETSTFPGDWEPLKGKKVKIIWVQPIKRENTEPDDSSRRQFAKSVFKTEYPKLSGQASDLAGVVIVFDSQDGGMAASTMATLQQWNAGHLSDSAFWKQCWLDPVEAFKE